MPDTYKFSDRFDDDFAHHPDVFFHNHDYKGYDPLPWDTSDKVYIGLVICIFVLFFICCCLTCQKRRQRAANCNSPVVVTSATHTAPGGYQVTQVPATTYQPNVYATPYPAQTTGNMTVQMPMPMPMPMPGVQSPMPGMQTHVYPPMQQPGAGAANMNPPSYDAAMAGGGPSVVPPGYEKQMPYNPNYGQQ